MSMSFEFPEWHAEVGKEAQIAGSTATTEHWLLDLEELSGADDECLPSPDVSGASPDARAKPRVLSLALEPVDDVLEQLFFPDQHSNNSKDFQGYPVELIPSEVMVRVLVQLDVRDCCSIACVCRHWRNVVTQSQELWRRHWTAQLAQGPFSSSLSACRTLSLPPCLHTSACLCFRSATLGNRILARLNCLGQPFQFLLDAFTLQWDSVADVLVGNGQPADVQEHWISGQGKAVQDRANTAATALEPTKGCAGAGKEGTVDIKGGVGASNRVASARRARKHSSIAAESEVIAEASRIRAAAGTQGERGAGACETGAGPLGLHEESGTTAEQHIFGEHFRGAEQRKALGTTTSAAVIPRQSAGTTIADVDSAPFSPASQGATTTRVTSARPVIAPATASATAPVTAPVTAPGSASASAAAIGPVDHRTASPAPCSASSSAAMSSRLACAVPAWRPRLGPGASGRSSLHGCGSVGPVGAAEHDAGRVEQLASCAGPDVPVDERYDLRKVSRIMRIVVNDKSMVWMTIYEGISAIFSMRASQVAWELEQLWMALSISTQSATPSPPSQEAPIMVPMPVLDSGPAEVEKWLAVEDVWKGASSYLAAEPSVLMAATGAGPYPAAGTSLWAALLRYWLVYDRWLEMVLEGCSALSAQVEAARQLAQRDEQIRRRSYLMPRLLNQGWLAFRAQVLLGYGLRSPLQHAALWLNATLALEQEGEALGPSPRSPLTADDLDLLAAARKLLVNLDVSDDEGVAAHARTRDKFQRCYGPLLNDRHCALQGIVLNRLRQGGSNRARLGVEEECWGVARPGEGERYTMD